MFFIKKRNREHNMTLTCDLALHEREANELGETDLDADLPNLKKAAELTPGEKEKILEFLLSFMAHYACEFRNFQRQVCTSSVRQKIAGYKATGLHKKMGRLENQEWLFDVSEAFHNIPEIAFKFYRGEWDDFNIEFLYNNLQDFSDVWYGSVRKENVSNFIRHETNYHASSYRDMAGVMKMLRHSEAANEGLL